MPNIIMILIILPHYTASSSKVRNQCTDEANHFHVCPAPEPEKHVQKIRANISVKAKERKHTFTGS